MDFHIIFSLLPWLKYSPEVTTKSEEKLKTRKKYVIGLILNNFFKAIFLNSECIESIAKVALTATTTTTTTANSTDFSNEERESAHLVVLPQDVLFYLANVCFFAAYLSPNTRYGQVFLHAGKLMRLDQRHAKFRWKSDSNHLLIDFYNPIPATQVNH